MKGKNHVQLTGTVVDQEPKFGTPLLVTLQLPTSGGRPCRIVVVLEAIDMAIRREIRVGEVVDIEGELVYSSKVKTHNVHASWAYVVQPLRTPAAA